MYPVGTGDELTGQEQSFVNWTQEAFRVNIADGFSVIKWSIFLFFVSCKIDNITVHQWSTHCYFILQASLNTYGIPEKTMSHVIEKLSSNSDEWVDGKFRLTKRRMNDNDLYSSKYYLLKKGLWTSLLSIQGKVRSLGIN